MVPECMLIPAYVYKRLRHLRDHSSGFNIKDYTKVLTISLQERQRFFPSDL